MCRGWKGFSGCIARTSVRGMPSMRLRAGLLSFLCRFDEKKQSMEPGFPRKIADDFPGVDAKLDAVFEAFGKRRLTLLAVGPLKCSVV